MLTVAKASAGAGKTFLLAKTYINHLFSQKKGETRKNPHRHILAVTFTVKATAEMKQRIIHELYLLSAGKKSAYADDLMQCYSLSPVQLQERAKSLLYDLLQDYSACMVNNIDAFFQQIIRSFAHELNLPGSYNLELDTEQIEQAAVDEFLFNLPADPADPSYRAIRQIVEDNLEGNRTWNPTAQLYAISKELHTEAFQMHKQQLSGFLHDKEALQNYRGRLFAVQTGYENRLRNLEKQFRDYLSANSLQEKDFSNGEKTFAPFRYTAEMVFKEKYKAPYSALRAIVSGDLSKAAKKGDTRMLRHAEALLPLFRQLLDLLTGEPFRRFMTAKIILQRFSLLALLTDIRYYIDLGNQRLNRLPIAQTNALLSDVIGSAGDVPFVYEKVGVRLRNFLMDEFQDTSTMQWNNFLPLLRESLATDNANLIVGDVKQSIYRWRNSNYELLQSGVQHVFPDSSVQLLTDNWRSDCAVVRCNNMLLSGLAAAANRSFNLRYGDQSSPLHDRILSVYADVEQTPEKNTEQGYVQVRFFSSDSSANAHTLPNEEVLRIIADLQQRGASLRQIAILVRYTADAVEIASCLQANAIPVISAEGLLLSSSPAVQLLMAAMRHLSQPDDKTLLFLFRHACFLCKEQQDSSKAISQALACTATEPFSSSAWEELHSLTALPLYQMVQALETVLAVQKSDPYVAAFNNVVFTYVQSHQADIFSFLDWWERHVSKLTLPPPADTDAVQILTIHKSKGLEFDHVIIPYFDWEMAEKASNSSANLLWVDMPSGFPSSAGNETTDSLLPVVPVPFDAKLSYSLFASDYWQELQNLYIDNLNLAYVAFTRAKRELYVLVPSYLSPNGSLSAKSKGSIGTLLQSVLSSQLQDDMFCQGEKTHSGNVPAVSENKTDEPAVLSDAAAAPLFNRLHLRLHRYSMFSAEHTADLGRQLDLGLVMHSLLQEVKHRGDERLAIDRLLQEGVILPGQRQQLEDEFCRFWDLVKSTNWFSHEARILCEQEILLPGESVRRPDRLVFFGNHAVVIDYKFGNRQSPRHARQVLGYMQLLRQMNFTVEGYLCYVTLNIIQSVEP